MKKVVRDIFQSIFLLIIGGLITYLFTINKERKDNKTRFLDYSFDINNKLLSVPEKEVSNDIKIFYKDSVINNLTSVVISIYNFSDKDYEDVPIYVTIKSLRSKDSLNIIQSSWEDMNGLPEQIEFIKEVPTADNSKRFHYNIKTANRASSLKSTKTIDQPAVPVLKLSYLMTGSLLLQVKTDIAKKGMEIRKYDLGNYEDMCISKPKFYILISAVSLIYLLFLIEFIKFISRQIRKDVLAKKLIEKKRGISETLSKEFPGTNNLPGIVEKIYEIQKKEDEAKGGWLNKIFGVRIFRG